MPDDTPVSLLDPFAQAMAEATVRKPLAELPPDAKFLYGGVAYTKQTSPAYFVPGNAFSQGCPKCGADVHRCANVLKANTSTRYFHVCPATVVVVLDSPARLQELQAKEDAHQELIRKSEEKRRQEKAEEDRLREEIKARQKAEGKLYTRVPLSDVPPGADCWTSTPISMTPPPRMTRVGPRPPVEGEASQRFNSFYPGWSCYHCKAKVDQAVTVVRHEQDRDYKETGETETHHECLDRKVTVRKADLLNAAPPREKKPPKEKKPKPPPDPSSARAQLAAEDARYRKWHATLFKRLPAGTVFAIQPNRPQHLNWAEFRKVEPTPARDNPGKQYEDHNWNHDMTACLSCHAPAQAAINAVSVDNPDGYRLHQCPNAEVRVPTSTWMNLAPE